MIKQITIDENNVVKAWSVGGYIENGIDVDDIPDDVKENPTKYCYLNGTYSENPNYKPPEQPIDEVALLKAQIQAQSEQMEFYEDCIAEMAEIVYA